MKTTVLSMAAALFLCLAGAAAQTPAPATPQAPPPATAQSPVLPPGTGSSTASAFQPGFDVFAGFSGAFFKGSVDYGQSLAITNTAGWNLGIRYHADDTLGFELRYGSSNNDYTLETFWSQYAQAHEIMGNVVFTMPTDGKVHPFFLAGLGVMNFSPESRSSNTPGGAVSQTKIARDLGGGLDYNLRGGLSARLEYRIILFAQPDFGLTTINGFHLANEGLLSEPTVGLFYHF